jgi:hypothetical protein
MFVLNRLLPNREYNLLNVLKALVSALSTRSLHTILLSKITSRYFTPFPKGMFRPFSVSRLRWSNSLGEALPVSCLH